MWAPQKGGPELSIREHTLIAGPVLEPFFQVKKVSEYASGRPSSRCANNCFRAQKQKPQTKASFRVKKRVKCGNKVKEETFRNNSTKDTFGVDMAGG